MTRNEKERVNQHIINIYHQQQYEKISIPNSFVRRAAA
jgi:hypothetical protein